MKTKKIILNFVVASTLLSVATPLLGVDVKAGTVSARDPQKSPFISENAGLDASDEKQVWPNEKIEQLTETLSELHPEFTKEYLKNLVMSQLNDEGIPPLSKKDIVTSHLTGTLSTKENWKGVTVAQAGAVIDTIIGTLIGNGAGALTHAGLNAAIRRMGRKELTRVVRQKLIRRFGAAGAVSSKLIDTALNYSSPGTMIAKYWDKHDAYPNNGRINFW
ncbi:hypothetical protein [Lactobacillus crispatus]|uniref:hypothetical protein n=1 Tax=Lactobacillus crispatus TaxID=47770 RepID=UPI0022E6339C|nr:hypothetical protein [Lactobacillus crispatus]